MPTQDIDKYFEEVAFNNFVELNTAYAKEYLTRFHEAYKTVHKDPELLESFEYAVKIPHDNELTIKVIGGNQIVNMRVDVLDHMFTHYIEKTGKTPEAFYNYYGMTKLEHELHQVLSDALCEFYALDRFDMYQALHRKFPEVKHIAKRSDIDQNDIEFYKFIFHDGTVVQLYAGWGEAVKQMCEQAYFAE